MIYRPHNTRQGCKWTTRTSPTHNSIFSKTLGFEPRQSYYQRLRCISRSRESDHRPRSVAWSSDKNVLWRKISTGIAWPSGPMRHTIGSSLLEHHEFFKKQRFPRPAAVQDYLQVLTSKDVRGFLESVAPNECACTHTNLVSCSFLETVAPKHAP